MAIPLSDQLPGTWVPHKHFMRLKSAGKMGYTFQCELCHSQSTIGKFAYWIPTLYLRWRPNLKGTSLA